MTAPFLKIHFIVQSKGDAFVVREQVRASSETKGWTPEVSCHEFGPFAERSEALQYALARRRGLYLRFCQMHAEMDRLTPPDEEAV